MDPLLDGYFRFRADVWPEERQRYQNLAKWGQRPETLVISCSDSRVDPQTIFGAVPGELFVVRNVAGLVPPYKPDTNYHGTSAALEYAVRVIKVKRIVVMGHAQCGGIRAMIDGVPKNANDFVKPWLELAEPVFFCNPASPGDDSEDYEREVIRLSITNLMTFPWVAAGLADSTLEVAGFRFDIHTGTLEKLDGQNFVTVK